MEQLDLAVDRALERVRVFFNADRCALLSVSADQQTVKVHLESQSEGLAPVSKEINLAQLFPWSSHRLLVDHKLLRFVSMTDLPPEAHVERKSWVQLQVRSALDLPIETGGIVTHIIALNSVNQEREWPDAFVSRLRVLGEMLVGALKRHEMFSELRASEARLASGVDLAGLGFYEVDFRAGVMYLDSRMRAICGFPADMDTGLEPLKFWMEHLHPDDRQQVMELREQLQDGRSDRLSTEYRFLHPTAGQRWIDHLAGVSTRDATGHAIRTYGVLRDITTRGEAEEALRQSHAEIERLKDRLQAETDYLRAEMKVVHPHGEVTGKSAGIRKVLRMVEQVAPTDSSVLVRGETGHRQGTHRPGDPPA